MIKKRYILEVSGAKKEAIDTEFQQRMQFEENEQKLILTNRQTDETQKREKKNMSNALGHRWEKETTSYQVKCTRR